MNTLKNSIIIGMLLLANTLFSQNAEVEFDVYTTSASKASQYLLADDVALRDCPSAQCTQLTTLAIGTHVRLLAKSEQPQTINNVTSRWYKIKMGPQIGWIWGGLISQKTLISTINPEIKFVFGEAGLDKSLKQQFQLRAVKNGVELDRLILTAKTLNYADVKLKDQTTPDNQHEVISLADNFNMVDGPMHVIWKDNQLQKLSNATSAINTNTTQNSSIFSKE